MIKRGQITLLFICLTISFPLYAYSQQAQESPNIEYKQGIELFENGLFERAVEKLKQFTDQYPEHNLQYSAQYYYARSLAKMDTVNSKAYYESYIREYLHTDFTTDLLFEMAKEAEQQKKYNEAITYYQRAIDIGIPNHKEVQAYYYLAEAAAENEDFDKARSTFMTIADEFPNSEWAPKALYARGRLYLNENKYDSSTDAFELLKERYPYSDVTRRIGTALGESYYQQERYEEAIDAFKNALPHLDDELKAKAVYLIAESYNYLNNFDKASTYYLQYINRTKGTDKVRAAQYGLGWVYHKQDIYHWAAREFGKAAEGSDELARKALYYKAINEKLGSRYVEAIETFREFGDRFSEGIWVEEAYYEWAITAYEMGNYTETIEVLLPLVRSEENLEWQGKIYTLLGEAYFANKEYTRSIQAFEAAEKVTDIDEEVKRRARFQKAWVQYSNQAYQQAQPIFEELYKKFPNSNLGKEALFWSADALYNMENYGPASAQFAQFVKQFPDHELIGPAYYSLGWSYFKQGDYKNAIEPLETFRDEYEPPEVALYPYETDTQLRIGDSYYAIGDYTEAIAQYQKEIGAEPGGDYAMFQIANSYYRNDQSYEAVTNFRKFLRIYPYSRFREQAQYNIAYIYLNTGNYTQAVEEFNKVINKYPNTSWAARSQYNIGDAYYNAGDYEQAVNAYKKVMEDYPDSEYIIEAVNGIQYAQLSAGEADSSSAILQDFLEDHPQTSMADRLRFRQADNRMQMGDYQAAVEEFKQYIRITNSRNLLPDAYFNLANAYEEIGEKEQAITQYQKVVAEFPNSRQAAHALSELGRMAFVDGHYQESFDYFKQLSEHTDADTREAYVGMGDARLAMKDLKSARKFYERVIDTDSDYAGAVVGLGKIALYSESYEQAQQLFEKVAESSSTESGAEAQYMLGKVQQEQRNFDEAIEAYSKVTILFEAHEEWVRKALLDRARSLIRLGRTGDARSTLNTLVEDYPDTPEAREAGRLLKNN